MEGTSVKKRWLSMFLFAIVLAAVPATAGTLYENGPISGTQDAWTINFGFVVSDTVTISGGTSTITGMAFGAWLEPGDTLTSVEVSFTSEEFGGTTYFDQVVNMSASNCFTNNYGFNVCQETGSFSGFSLPNGTYWMNLGNASTPNGDPVYWDQNGGIGCHSEGCPSQPSENTIGTIPAESFSVFGTVNSTGTTPEPGSLLLLGSGALAVVGWLRSKLS
jgi:hypothetical protein